MPKVSVVIAVYNGDAYIQEAIHSILRQTFTDFELIIVDDGSTDHTPEILKSYDDKRIQVISQINQGPAAAANVGIRASSAEYIARLDADDIAAPNRLEKQVEFLDQNSDCVIVGGFMEFITADGEPIYIQTLPLLSEDIKKSIQSGGCPYVHSAVMFRKQSALECGLYNDDLRYYEDPDFYKRLATTDKMSNLPICLGKYRIALGATTNQPRTALKKQAEILHKAEVGRLSDDERQFLKHVTIDRSTRVDRSVYALRVGKAYLQHTSDTQSARRYLLRSVKAWIFNGPAWYNLFLACSPLKLRLAINRLRRLES